MQHLTFRWKISSEILLFKSGASKTFRKFEFLSATVAVEVEGGEIGGLTAERAEKAFEYSLLPVFDRF